MTKTILDRLKEEGITHVNAGFRSYEIKVKTAVTDDDGNKCFGYVDWEGGNISLEKNMKAELARETLLHELLHVCFAIVGLGGDEANSIVAARPNEELTVQTTTGLLLLMNLNPKLFELLNESAEQ